MFIELKKEIITQAAIEDLEFVKYARKQENYWSSENKKMTQEMVKRHFTRVDYIIDELVKQSGEPYATYKQVTVIDEERLKLEHPQAFETCSEKKINPKALELFYPHLAKEYRKPTHRSLKIVA